MLCSMKGFVWIFLTNTRITNRGLRMKMAFPVFDTERRCSTQVQTKEWISEQLRQESSWSCRGTDVIGRQALSNVLIKRYHNQGEWTLMGEQMLLDPNPTSLFSSLDRSLLSTHSCLLLSVSRTPPPRPDPSQRLNSRAQLPKSSCPSTCELLFTFWGPLPSASPSHSC